MKNGFPARAFHQEALQGRKARIGAQQGQKELRQALAGQRVKRQLVVVRSAPPWVLMVGAVGDDQHQASILGGYDELVQQTESQRVAPVEVIDDRDDRPHVALAQQQAGNRLIGVLPMTGWVDGSERMITVQRIEEIQQRWKRILHRRVERCNSVGDLLADRSRAVVGADLEISPEQVDDRQIRCRPPVRRGVRFQNQPVRRVRRMKELVQQARLARPSLADDRNHLTETVGGEPLRVAQSLQFDAPTDETRQAASGGRLEARSCGADASQLVDWYRLGQSLDRHQAKRVHGDIALRQLEGIGRGQHGARLGQLFHATCQMRGLAHDGEVHVQIVADGTDDDLTRIDPDADRHRHSVSVLKLFRISRNGLLHSQRRITSVHRMILDRERRAEQRHDAVAHDPVHRALVAVDGLGHAFDHRIEQQFLRGLGIAVDQQLHRTRDIGKQHRDLLPLTLEGRPCGEDLVSKVLGHVTLGRGSTGHRPQQIAGNGRIRSRTSRWATPGFRIRCIHARAEPHTPRKTSPLRRSRGGTSGTTWQPPEEASTWVRRYASAARGR